ETHLYPAAQKKLMELLAFVANHSQGMFITTHSPYVLGSLNNLLYAGNRPAKFKKKIAEIIPEEYQLKHIDAFYLKDGGIESAIDNDMKPLIENGLIDDVSHELNDEIDRMIDLKYRKEQ
ncbi:MAG: ATP-binding protein, partial [Lentisphaeria bacterium]|nr:ATP-binding protein [Lentisphaeria bacterium]